MAAKNLSPSIAALVLGLALAASLPVAAEEAQTGDPSLGGQSLDQAASDPTASLMSVQVQNLYSGDYHQLDDESRTRFNCARPSRFRRSVSTTLRG